MDEQTRGYDRLAPAEVRATLDRLHDRIVATFPGRHLADVTDEVRAVVGQIEDESGAPWWTVVRVASQVALVVLVGLIVVALVSAVHSGLGQVGQVRAFDWLTIVESGVNDVVFAAIAVWFLRSVPDRVRRRRLLAILYRLRSLAHIVDMHQMSKDADQVLSAGEPSDDRDRDRMTVAELGRYYDFCSELLSLTSKAAALCGEDSTDAVVLDTVSEIENLTSSMSRKIWQKISLLRLSGTH